MHQVYHINCANRTSQVAFAKKLEAELIYNVLKAIDLVTATEYFTAFLDKYTGDFSPDPSEWTDEDDQPYNAYKGNPELVWERLTDMVNEELAYLNGIIKRRR